MTEEQIKEAATTYTDNIFGSTAINHVRTAIEAGFVAGTKFATPQWALISNQFPPKGKDILLSDGQDVTMGLVSKADGYVYYDNTISLIDKFTHWMPLPSPSNTQP